MFGRELFLRNVSSSVIIVANVHISAKTGYPCNKTYYNVERFKLKKSNRLCFIKNPDSPLRFLRLNLFSVKRIVVTRKY
ncbi:hypothetical protein BpHYR1_044501 [Brachionus plicatilis]|uniref:Uncharacterized protein n=1 Tax=Brachionus plicatilis TaxID=10195 RepID=A0A3M7SZG6_BRAPC|nr:hypothetical protein BpHYR1_044501 [Brachionus plicatilis]